MPNSVATRLRHSYTQAAAAHLLQQACLRTLLDSLMAEGISPIVLKGMPLAESLYPDPALRQAGDIDLMLRPSETPRAERILESLGYIQAGDRELQNTYKDHHHHLAPYVHQSLPSVVELHSHILRPSSAWLMDSGALWDRVRASSTSGASHLLLAPEDQLLHLCVHFYNDRRLARSGGLLHLCDIALFLERKSGEVDWDEFADRVLRHCPGNAVYTSLYCAAAIGGASPPEAVLDALRPRGFDDSRARLFMARRVTGTSQRVRSSISSRPLRFRRASDRLLKVGAALRS